MRRLTVVTTLLVPTLLQPILFYMTLNMYIHNVKRKLLIHHAELNSYLLTCLKSNLNDLQLNLPNCPFTRAQTIQKNGGSFESL